MTVNLTSGDDKNLSSKESLSLTAKINLVLENFTRIPLKEKLFFVQYLGIMLKAGIPLSSSMNTLSLQTGNKKFKKIIKNIAEKVEKGGSLADSLRAYEKIFGELFINMIEAGELSGKLEDVLVQLYLQLKKQHELISKVKGAVTYPAVILFAMGGIGIFMITVVIPKIMEMFKEFNAELPLPTKILIGLSDFVLNNGLLTIAAVIIAIFAFLQTIHTKKGKYYFHLLLLRLPIFGAIIKKINLAKFSRTISSLLKTDIMIIKTLQITGNVMNNVHYREALFSMSEKIRNGGQINEVIKEYPKLFPPVVAQMIAVGEQTGEIDSILAELAEFYENEVDQTMTNLPAIIEPLLILILGCGVGAMAVAIIMPMYSLSTVI